MKTKALVLAAALATASFAPRTADAFCGFYVGGADAKLVNNATQVVLMRDGQRTVLSMQNAYQGPPENFAMVVPVPVVLQKENVKVLDRKIFERVDTLTAPRLVEYWEQDPCSGGGLMAMGAGGMAKAAAAPMAQMARSDAELGVKVEAQFTVGEYEVVILSALDSAGLETWLHQNKYTIPAGAEPYLRPYVQQGSKFFVAKVDPKKVTFEGTQAMLSPIRFFYDAERFTLPIRLGLINSGGTQDLVVNILADNQRYEAANYPNVTVPTNIDLTESAKSKFAETYAALFDRTVEQNPRAVVTEYSWQATSCDPCPTTQQGLSPSDIATLGGDVAEHAPAAGAAAAPRAPAAGPPRAPAAGPPRAPAAGPPRAPAPQPPGMFRRMGGGMVITRLHVRYGKETLGEDLVFKAAPPIVGGREMPGKSGQLEKGATPAPFNNFQARYAIRHPWAGPIKCENPVRGRWGGPTDLSAIGEPLGPKAAQKIAFAPRTGMKLAFMVREDIPEIGLAAAAAPAPAPAPQPSGSASAAPTTSAAPDDVQRAPEDPLAFIGCGVQSGTSPGAPRAAALAALAALAFAARRRRA